MASFEARQVKEVKDYVEREGIDCDFEETRVFDVCLHKAGRDKAEADLAAITDADISTARDMGVFLDKKAEDVCIVFLGGKIWQELTQVVGLGCQRIEVLSDIQRCPTLAVQAYNSHAGASS